MTEVILTLPELSDLMFQEILNMRKEDFKTLDNQLSLGTKLLVCMTLALLIFSYWFKDVENLFFLSSLFSLIVVLLVEYFVIVPRMYPKIWRIIKWLTIIGIIFLTLTSF